jgi:hypothetical protein
MRSNPQQKSHLIALAPMIKILFFYLMALNFYSCTTNSTYYPILKKDEFSWEESLTPTTQTHSEDNGQLIKAQPFKHQACFNQWLFFNNAHKESLQHAQNYFRHICENKIYLIDTNARWTWWTLLFFSQSCIDLEGFCAK